MRLATTFILILLLLSQVGSKWIIVASYTLQKDYIAKTLCVNQSRPQLKCHGKCQLAKKLAEEEKQNNTPQGQNQGKVKVIDGLFDDRTSLPALAAVNEGDTQTLPGYLVPHYTSPSYPIFHPPA